MHVKRGDSIYTSDSVKIPQRLRGTLLHAVYYRNDGTRQEPKFVLDPSLAIDLPHNGAPVFVDIDGDGKLDLFAGGLNGGLRFFRRK